jgi:hypothetical protein
MKLKTVKTYQSVRFNQKDETSFDIRVQRYDGIEMEFDAKSGLVKLQMGSEVVYVFGTNIAYMVPLELQGPTELKKAK